MQRSLLASVCGALLFALAGCGGGVSAAGRGFLLPRAHGSVQQIVLWRSGRAARPLGPSRDWIDIPAWSPDGKSIAFADERGGREMSEPEDIYVMNASGGDVRRLTYDSERPNVFRADSPSWSPDGSEIVFVRELNGPYDELVTVALRSGRERNLRLHGGDPAWGRAGIAYVYAKPRSLRQRIMLLRPGSRRPTLLARTRVPVAALAWSPHGVLAALEGLDRVFLYSATGRLVGRFAVPRDAKRLCGMAWSRDGTRIALAGGRKPGFWITTPTGSKWRRSRVTGVVNTCEFSWR